MVQIAARHGAYRASWFGPIVCAVVAAAAAWDRSELCIGVRKEETRLKAHAWLEIDGVVITDSRRHP